MRGSVRPFLKKVFGFDNDKKANKENAVKLLGLGSKKDLDAFNSAMEILSAEYRSGVMKFRLILMNAVREGKMEHARIVQKALIKCNGDHEELSRVLRKAISQLN